MSYAPEFTDQIANSYDVGVKLTDGARNIKTAMFVNYQPQLGFSTSNKPLWSVYLNIHQFHLGLYGLRRAVGERLRSQGTFQNE